MEAKPVTHLNYCPAGGQLSSSLSPLLGQLEAMPPLLKNSEYKSGYLMHGEGAHQLELRS